MFATKQKRLFNFADSKTSSFLQEASKVSNETLSGNGALKYRSTGCPFVDQMGSFGTYKTPRSYDDIARDCEALWFADKTLCVKFILYIRMISRKTDIHMLGITTEAPQSGGELKHEGLMRMLWLYQKDETIFWKNIGLFLAAGSYKDLINMLRYDLIYHGWDNRVLNWDMFASLIAQLLEMKSTTNLMKKYLPTIRANKQCTTVESQANNIIGKWICNKVFGSKNYAEYRRYKSSGTAHIWQKLISQKRFKDLDFNKIHGRALNLLVKSKFLKNQSLQARYEAWLKSKKTVKYTGFVHELLCELDYNKDRLFKDTVDKQFNELVNKAKNDENLTNLIVVRDVSGSMGSTAQGTKYTSFAIAKAMSIYFSEFLSGAFSNAYINFNSSPKLHFYQADTASGKWFGDHAIPSMNTDFLSVIRLFCNLLKTVPESEFPKGILCISDGEFDRVGSHKETNIESAKRLMRKAGFSDEYVENFRFVFWDVRNSFYGVQKPKFETFGNVKNVFYLSGYSASNVKFILNNKVETAQDLFENAMDQELLNLVTV